MGDSERRTLDGAGRYLDLGLGSCPRNGEGCIVVYVLPLTPWAG